jgi:hypothetical protein
LPEITGANGRLPAELSEWLAKYEISCTTLGSVAPRDRSPVGTIPPV